MITAIVPAYNEEKNLGVFLKKLKRYTKDIIVVDDGSKDRTYEIARKSNVVAIRHAANLGKGAAMRTGIEKAIQMGKKNVVFIDADNQHDASEIKAFEKKLGQGYDIVQGFRGFNKKMPFLKRFGNSSLNRLFGTLFGGDIKDVLNGFKALKTGIYPKVRWESDGYFVETEILANAIKNKLKIGQIPNKTIYVDEYKGISVFDGIRIFLKMLVMRLNI